MDSANTCLLYATDKLKKLKISELREPRSKIIGKKKVNEKLYVFEIQLAKVPQFHNFKIFVKNSKNQSAHQ